MATATLLRQLRILEIIIICFLTKSLEGRALNNQQYQADRIKRGFSHYGGNDFGSSVHVSSSVLQYAAGDEHSPSFDSSSHVDSSGLVAGHSGGLGASSDFDTSSLSASHSGGLDSVSHLDSLATNTDSWSATGLSSGYEVWLEPLPMITGTSSGLDTSSIGSSHPGSSHVSNTGFSDDSIHSAHFELPNSQLHTQISSSSSSSANIGGGVHDHGAVAISDNIDFNNVADIKSKHYAKSYRK